MTEIEEIISCTSHRPWAIPNGKWGYYQEWNNALFLHWKIQAEELIEFLPKNILLDTFNGDAWISLVAFTMEKIRPRFLPSMKMISDFHEINIRTYLMQDNKQGVYFLNIEAQKQISSLLAKLLSGLPYKKSSIKRFSKDGIQKYTASNNNNGSHFDTTFVVGEKINERSELDKWLTEKYCLYLNCDQEIYRYEIHHKPWQLYNVEISDLTTDYKIGNISLNKKPVMVHYSEGVKVLAWKKKKLGKKVFRN